MLTPLSVSAQTYLSSGHIDFVEVSVAGSTFPQLALGIHDHDNDIGYALSGLPGATNWAKLVVVPQAIAPRPSAASFDPIGVTSGSDFWWLRNPQNPATLYGGMAAEDIIPTNQIGAYHESDSRVNATARWIKISLVDKRGPGDVSVWTESGGNPTFWWATSDGVTSTDAAFVVAGGHLDYNWGFTAAGDYELDVRATAFDAAMQPISSEIDTLHFQVVPVPEPLMLGVIGIAFLGLRRMRG